MEPALIIEILRRQWGHLFPWSPVLFGIGIAIYFALPAEPSVTVWTLSCLVALAMLAFNLVVRSELKVLPIAILIAVSGFATASWRAHDVSAPKLGFRYYGPIEGRIIAVDRSASDAPRITLDQVRLDRVSLNRRPAQVRVSLHGTAPDFIEPAPGQVVMMTGHLSPPGGPVEPGGFDFRRQAWFKGLGAVGYTRTPVLMVSGTPAGTALGVERIRFAISDRVHGVLPGRTGAFATAITTGDRSAMDAATLEALRVSNLAHLLAISGLHMGMLTGFVFLVLRLGLAAWPRAALNWPIKKIAASGGLIAGAVYLALSGGNVATERAFIMVAVMLLALLLDRRAISLRAVAVAALIVLCLRPEALLGPGFQMSFAATTALVAVFEALRRDPSEQVRRGRVMRWLGALVLTSLVAGLATAPFAAAHFNRVPHMGLLANVLSVPVMGFVVMPSAVLAAVLAPFGADWIGLRIMAPGIDWILAVADFTAGLPGAVSHVKSPPVAVLGGIALGALILALWRGKGRLMGVPLVAVAFAIWFMAERPPLLISESGGMTGLMTEDGRALSRLKGEGFAADNWLENDGDPANRETAFARLKSEGRLHMLTLDGTEILHATGKVAAASAISQCDKSVIVVVNIPVETETDCNLYDVKRLRQTGSLAIWPGATANDPPIIIGARGRGDRLWSRQ